MDKKKVLIVVLIIAVLGVAGFALFKFKNSDDADKRETVGVTVSCGDVFQCIEVLDPQSSIEEMSEIIGSDAELAQETSDSKIYKWTLADDTTIEARITSFVDGTTGDKISSTTVYANYPEGFITHDADLSNLEDLRTAMGEADGITYEQVVEAVGGSKGMLTEKSPGSKRYQWFGADGSSLDASFDDETGKCLMLVGGAA